jgi:hypothetical protein
MRFTDLALMALQLVAPLLAGAITWALAKLAAHIQASIQNQYLQGVLLRIDHAVVTVVKDLQRTVVDQIKAASADGKITADERRRIKNAALDLVKSYLGAKGLRVLGDVLGLSGGALDDFLSSRIEAAVHDVRVTDRAVGGPRPSQPPSPAAPSAIERPLGERHATPPPPPPPPPPAVTAPLAPTPA